MGVRPLLPQPPSPLLLTSIHKAVIIAQLLNNHLILECFLLLTPCHGPQEDHLVALKDSPVSQIPSQGSSLICHSNQQSPTGFLTNGLRCHTKDSGLLHQRWIDTGPLINPSMVSPKYHCWYQCIYQFSWRIIYGA